jgi:signal peptidase I
MQRLKKIFETIHTRYVKQRSSFVGKINNWGRKGKLSVFRQGRKIIAQLDSLFQELVITIDSLRKDEKDKAKKKEIKQKIGKIKKLYRELSYTTRPRWSLWVEFSFIALLLAFLFRAFFFGLYHVPSGSMEPTLLVGDRVLVNKMIYNVTSPERGDVVLCDSLHAHYDTSSWWRYSWQRYIGVEIVAFGLKSGPSNFVRRIVAKPGDVIEGKIENGRPLIYVNEKKSAEKYINKYPLIALRQKTGFFDSDKVGPFGMPLLLQKKEKVVFYTYDPEHDFDQQPFYKIDCRNILRLPGSLDIQCCAPFTPSVNEKGKIIDRFGPYKLPEGKYWVMGDSRKNSIDSRQWLFVDKKLIRGRVGYVVWSVDSEEPFWLLEMVKHPLRFCKKLLRLKRIMKSIK